MLLQQWHRSALTSSSCKSVYCLPCAKCPGKSPSQSAHLTARLLTLLAEGTAEYENPSWRLALLLQHRT